MRHSLLRVFPLSLALGAYALAAPAMVKETTPGLPVRILSSLTCSIVHRLL